MGDYLLALLVRCACSEKEESIRKQKMTAAFGSDLSSPGMILDSHAPRYHYGDGSEVRKNWFIYY